MSTVAGYAPCSTQPPVPPASKGSASWVLPPLYRSEMLWGPPQSPGSLEPPLVSPQGSGSQSLSCRLLEEPGPGLWRLVPLSVPLEPDQGVSLVLHLHIIAFIVKTCA